MGTGASTPHKREPVTVPEKPSSPSADGNFDFYKTELQKEKDRGKNNLEVFEQLKPVNGLRNLGRGSCPDIAPTLSGNFPAIKKFQSDLGIPLSEEKRRRAQVFEGTSMSNMNFMATAGKKRSKEGAPASKEQMEAGAIVMAAFRKVSES